MGQGCNLGAISVRARLKHSASGRQFSCGASEGARPASKLDQIHHQSVVAAFASRHQPVLQGLQQ
jgi:hypothetical protein